MKKILFVGRTNLTSLSGSGTLLRNIIVFLEKHFEVSYLYCDNRSCAWDAPVLETERVSFENVLKEYAPDIIFTDRHWLNDLFDGLDHGIKRVSLIHDLRTRVLPEMMGLPGFINPTPWSVEKESILLAKAALLLALNREDEALCNKLAPRVKSLCVGVSMPVIQRDPEKEKPNHILYVASEATENLHAITWFLDNAWDHVLREIPEAVLTLCGGVSNRIPHNKYRNLALLSAIKDMEEPYAAAQLVIVPHITRGGLKLKFAEAMARGIPVVANTCGIDGFPEAFGTSAFVTDNPGAFAAHIVNILQDRYLRGGMGDCAHDIARKRMTDEAAFGDLLNALSGIDPIFLCDDTQKAKA